MKAAEVHTSAGSNPAPHVLLRGNAKVSILGSYPKYPGSTPGPAINKLNEGENMLQWNVYRGDCNSGEIIVYNIFNHWSFYEACVKAKKKYNEDREGFEKEIRSCLMYYFWSKCEHEVVLEHWPSGEMYGLRKTFTKKEMCCDLKYPEDKLFCDSERAYEVHVFPEKNRYKKKKIDIYDQVMNNWDVFIDYLWNNRKELKVRK